MKQLIVISIVCTLISCGRAPVRPGVEGASIASPTWESLRLFPVFPDNIQPGFESTTLDASVKWNLISEFSIAGHSNRTSQALVGTVPTGNGCSIVRTDPRIRTDAKWSPLPLVMRTPERGKDASGVDILSDLFNQTLDFSEKDPEKLFFRVDFVRGKTYRSLWQLQVEKVAEECVAFAMVCNETIAQADGSLKCSGEYRAVDGIEAEVNKIASAFSLGKPEREKNDISKLKVFVRELSGGVPSGERTPYEWSPSK